MGKYSFEEVYENFKLHGFELIMQDYFGVKQKLVFKDIEGYYYENSFDGFKNNIKHNRGFPKFHISNSYTIQNIKLWLKLNNKPFELLSNTYEDANKNLQWKCLKEECSETFDMTWGNLSFGQGCPYCAGQKVGLSNCLATKNPELAREWHPIKNGDLTPYDVTLGSGQDIWWKCKDNSKHEWHSRISKRIQSKGCPHCNQTKISEDYNLITYNVDLREYWNYNKNPKLPQEYAPNSNEEVWWLCKDCGNDWREMIYTVNKRNNVCLQCNRNKNERLDGNFVVNEFKLKGFIPLFDELYYENNTQELPYICSNHKDKGIQYIRYGNLQQGKGCKYCFNDRRGDIRRKDSNKVIKDFIDKNLKPLFLPEAYVNNSTPLPYICLLHENKGVQYIKYGNLLKGKGCRYCGIEEISGKNSYLWRGGITNENKALRNRKEYKQWRNSVFKRDDYTCQVCGVRGGKLQAHHIENFSSNKELRFNVNNGITMCFECHDISSENSFHKLYTMFNNTKQQLEEYIQRYKNGEFKKLPT